MDKQRAKELQRKMPYKHLFHDIINGCYRLINPQELYEYKDEEGKIHVRSNGHLIPVQ